MTDEQHNYYGDLCELSWYMQEIQGKKQPNLILYAMAEAMSEENLHEVIAAICEKLDYQMGYRTWFGSRSNFIDRDYAREYLREDW